MLFDLFGTILFSKYYYSRFDALVDVSLSEGWRHDHDAGQSFLGEAIDAVVVIFVVHPKLKLFKFSLFLVHSGLQLHFNWWITQYHV